MEKRKMSIEKFAQSVASDAKNGYGIVIPWEIILDLVIKFVDKCFQSSKDFQLAAKAPTLVQMSVMRNELRKQNPSLRWKDADVLAKQVFAQAAEMDVTQLEAAYNEVKAAVEPIDYDMGV
jgi:hypothetical protein